MYLENTMKKKHSYLHFYLLDMVWHEPQTTIATFDCYFSQLWFVATFKHLYNFGCMLSDINGFEIQSDSYIIKMQ